MEILRDFKLRPGILISELVSRAWISRILIVKIATSQRQALTISQSVSFYGQCIFHFLCPFFSDLSAVSPWHHSFLPDDSRTWFLFQLTEGREGKKSLLITECLKSIRNTTWGMGIWIFYPSLLERKAKEKKPHKTWREKDSSWCFLGFIVEKAKINPFSPHPNLSMARFTYKGCFNFKTVLISSKSAE